MTQKVPDTFPPCGGSSASHNPLMHVQDQKPTGIQGGSSVVGDNHRTLNTVLINEITGASLASNQVTLPAGTYYIDSFSSVRPGENGKAVLMVYIDGIRYLKGIIVLTRPAGTAEQSANFVKVSGQIVLNSVATLTCITHHTIVYTNTGLGSPLDKAATGNEVYTDLQIWKLDSVVKAPVIRDNNLYPIPGTAYLTGNIIGLGYSYATANSINVEAGLCYDSLNTTLLNAGSGQSVSIPTTINTVQNLFVCDDGIVRTDTDVNGTTLLAGTVSQLRWIGFVRTNSSGDIIDFGFLGDYIEFNTTEYELGSLSGTPTFVDFSALVPHNRTTNHRVSSTSRASGGVDSGSVFGSSGSWISYNVDGAQHLMDAISIFPKINYAGAGTAVLVNCLLLR